MKGGASNTSLTVPQIDRPSVNAIRAALYWPCPGFLEGILQAFTHSTKNKTIDRLEKKHAMD